MMLCDIQLKIEVNYSHYFDRIRVKCPFCEFYRARTRTFQSLKQLGFHLSTQHKNEADIYPFKLEDIQSLMQTIALGIEWKLLP